MSRIKPIEHAARAPHQSAARDWAKTHVTQDMWNMVFVVVAAVLIIGIVAGIGSMVSSLPGTAPAPVAGGKTASAAAEDARAFIAGYMVPEGVTVEVVNTTEESGLYAVGIKLTSGTDVIDAVTYVSKDGRLLFTQGINMPEERAKPTATPTPAPAPFDAPNAEKPEAAFFVMSFCPYGQQAEAGLAPVYAALGDAAEWSPHYVIYSNYNGGGPDYCIANGTLCSLHGVNEVNEDARQLCVKEEYGTAKWWEYVAKVNADCSLSNIEACWKTAASSVGVDTAKITACQTSRAVELLAAEKALGDSLGVRGSPTIFVNNELYQGGRAAEDLKKAVCSGFDTEPSACSATLGSTTAATTGSC